VGFELPQQGERVVVVEGAVGVYSNDDPVPEAVPQRDHVGQVLLRIDADLEPEVTKAPVVEPLRRLEHLGAGRLHGDKTADTDPLATLAAEELVHGEPHRLAGDVVQRVGHRRLRVERVVERLVERLQDAADVERRAAGQPWLELVLDRAHEVPEELGAALPAPGLGLADPDDALVGVHPDDERVDRLPPGALRDLERLGEGQTEGDRLDLGDLHAATPRCARRGRRTPCTRESWTRGGRPSWSGSWLPTARA